MIVLDLGEDTKHDKNETTSSEIKKPSNFTFNSNNYNNNIMRSNYNNPIVVSKPTYDYEKRIIEEVLETSGISLKPSDGQLKEFNKKIKNLNKDVIIEFLNEKINNNINDVKIITKILWVIDSILKEKNNLENYWEYYKQNEKNFEELYYLKMVILFHFHLIYTKILFYTNLHLILVLFYYYYLNLNLYFYYFFFIIISIIF